MRIWDAIMRRGRPAPPPVERNSCNACLHRRPFFAGPVWSISPYDECICPKTMPPPTHDWITGKDREDAPLCREFNSDGRCPNYILSEVALAYFPSEDGE